MKIEGFFAHRGLYLADQSIRENSREAFESACLAGYGIELDVQLSRDNVVVVEHDDSLARLYGKNVLVRQMDAKTLHDEFAIMSLDEVLKLVDGRVPLIIELKSMAKQNHNLARATQTILEGYRGPYCVESFDPRLVNWFRKHAPHTTRGQLMLPMSQYKHKFMGYLISNCWINKITKPHFIALRKDMATTPKVRKFYKKQRLPLVGWTLIEGDENWYHAAIFEHMNPKHKEQSDE